MFQCPPRKANNQQQQIWMKTYFHVLTDFEFFLFLRLLVARSRVTATSGTDQRVLLFLHHHKPLIFFQVLFFKGDFGVVIDPRSDLIAYGYVLRAIHCSLFCLLSSVIFFLISSIEFIFYKSIKTKSH